MLYILPMLSFDVDAGIIGNSTMPDLNKITWKPFDFLCYGGVGQ